MEDPKGDILVRRVVGASGGSNPMVNVHQPKARGSVGGGCRPHDVEEGVVWPKLKKRKKAVVAMKSTLMKEEEVDYSSKEKKRKRKNGYVKVLTTTNGATSMIK
ncbi:hypothetical protein ACLOJK_017690 [Asimina triloba]